jgi:hypothetical protein
MTPYRTLNDDGSVAEIPRRPMRVMPSNSTGWVWHSLSRETGRLAHLLSPGQQRGPWPWFPYALDNGAFTCWDRKHNTFDESKWESMEAAWRRLLFWAQSAPLKPQWAIVPDVPGNGEATIARWAKYAPDVVAAGIPLAIAVQDGMTNFDVEELDPAPEVICVGGTDEWKWSSVWLWCHDFPRVHLLRCNAPTKLDQLESDGVESCDGTGWNRGDRKQTAGLEHWCRARAVPTNEPLWPYVCRENKDKKQLTFA